MAQDKMMNDDVNNPKQDFGKQTPGRNPQHDQQTGQKGAGQKDQNKPSQAEGEDFDEFDGGSGRAGQNR